MFLYLNIIISSISDVFVWICNLKFLSLLKIVFLILFLLINFCLIYFEYLENKNNKSNYLQQGIGDQIKKIWGTAVTGVGLYASYLTIKSESETKKIIAEEKQKRIDTENLSKSKLDTVTGENLIYKMKIEQQTRAVNKLEASNDEINSLEKKNYEENLQSEANNYDETSPMRADLSHKIMKAEADLMQARRDAEKAFNDLKAITVGNKKLSEEYSKIDNDEKLKELINKSTKSSILDLDELFNNFDSLDGISKLALSLCFSSSIILWCLLGIFLNFYGNYLLENFKLDERYPKIAIFIKFRKRLSKYYIISNFLIIISLCLINIIFGLSILSL